MSENKKFTIDSLDEISSKYDEMEEITITVKTHKGEEKSTLKINKYFSPSKIDLCVQDLIVKIDYAKIYFDDDVDSDSLFQAWLMLLTIKHFTDLDVPSSFKRQVAVLEKMLEADVLFQIFSYFEPSEIKKIMEKLAIVTQEIMDKIGENEDLLKKLEEHDIEQREVIKNILESK